MKCIFCGGELCWNNDFTRDEVFGDGDNSGIVGYYTCMTCGREYEIGICSGLKYPMILV